MSKNKIIIKPSIDKEEAARRAATIDAIFSNSDLYSKSITFSDWVSIIGNHIAAMENKVATAQKQLKEFNKDEEILFWKNKCEEMNKSQRYGFPVTEEEYNAINEWQRKHDAEKHGLKTVHERLRAGGAIGGRYFYKFVPTSIGVSGECVCARCHQLAMLEAECDTEEYRRQMDKLGGSFEFQEIG